MWGGGGGGEIIYLSLHCHHHCEPVWPSGKALGW